MRIYPIDSATVILSW